MIGDIVRPRWVLYGHAASAPVPRLARWRDLCGWIAPDANRRQAVAYARRSTRRACAPIALLDLCDGDVVTYVDDRGEQRIGTARSGVHAGHVTPHVHVRLEGGTVAVLPAAQVRRLGGQT